MSRASANGDGAAFALDEASVEFDVVDAPLAVVAAARRLDAVADAGVLENDAVAEKEEATSARPASAGVPDAREALRSIAPELPSGVAPDEW